MSMLSVQIDELRNAARGQKAMGLFELAQMLNDAADTIWQLRDDLQRANAENAKLRELCVSMYEFSMSEYPDGTELNFADRMRELGVEVDE